MKKSELRSLLGEIEALVTRANSDSSSKGKYDRDASDVEPAGVRALLARKSKKETLRATKSLVHRFGEASVCCTDERGQSTPGGRSPLDIVLDASEGFIPLWANGETLRWKFNETSLERYIYPAALKDYVRDLMSKAVLAWGNAAPVTFKETDNAWDFELVVLAEDDCDADGCTLASAFFPDAGRHQLKIYPKMFEQSASEQVSTLVHEIGHVFGLRHFFADVSETAWPSEIFGAHNAFSIMNYGWRSQLTEDDKEDLKRLYQAVWSGEFWEVNGTPIRLVRPFHASGQIVSPGCESRVAAARR